MMLNIKRRAAGRIINDAVVVTVAQIAEGQAALPIEFPEGHNVWREEIWLKRQQPCGEGA
jgi:sRNA-binding carbon storage regulator CsrA